MHRITAVVVLALLIASPLPAVDFLGIELCKGGVKTSVEMPEGSALKLEEVSLGKHGGLVMIVKSERGDVLSRIDDLMTSYTGGAGSGDEKMLQWSGNKLFALASVKKDGRAALAVSTSDECLAAKDPGNAKSMAVETDAADPKPVAAAGALATGTAATEQQNKVADGFELQGELKHSPAMDAWVDVMGVVVNASGAGYQLATFDLSFFDADGNLICVDTISVSELKAGQQRPFRDSIQCPDYSPEAIASHQLHFAGGY